MKQKTKRWLLPLIIIVMTALAALIANPRPTGIGWLDGALGKMKINMGLDLQGGVHLEYEADMSNIESGKESEALSGIQDVIEKRVNAFGVAEPVVYTTHAGVSQTASSGVPLWKKITNFFAGKKESEDETSRKNSGYRLIVELAGVSDIEEAKQMIKETPFLEFKEIGEDKTELTQEQQQFLDEQASQIQQENEEMKKKAEEILQRALNGEDFVQLARDNSTDEANAENGGDLDFFKRGVMDEVFEGAAFSDDLAAGQIYPEVVQSQFGYHVIKKTDERGEGDEKEVRASHILLKATDAQQFRDFYAQQLLQGDYESTGLTGKELKRSQVDFDPQTNQPVVLLQFNDQGKEMFKDITERNVGKQVAIFLDGDIISAPVVNDVIRNGEAVISGNFKLQEAKELSQRLNAGALPVPITLVSQRSIEASLGKVSLEKSLKAGAFGLAAVAIFMVVYYRLAGVVAVAALTIYVLLMVSIIKLSSLSQSFTITLTLSGIAGFILSVGMAVDANILIFERMKEEIRRGRDLKTSLEEGFKRAWSSIRDGNYSTILTCLVLMMFGSGFIKGFAITLMLGVLLSMFTAIVITRVVLRTILVGWLENHKGLVIVSTKRYNEKKREGKEDHSI